jgi:nitric oxide reductase NorD protein
VAPADPGEPAWTDGVTVFVDAVASAVYQVESVAVQASLLACGGLEPDVVRKLVRRPALARRYLAVEGQRALTANDDLLPFPARSIVDLDLAMRSDSPAASLQIASGRDAIADPPASFGVIRPRNCCRRMLPLCVRAPACTPLVTRHRSGWPNSRTPSTNTPTPT